MAASLPPIDFSPFAMPDELMSLETTDEAIPRGEPGLRTRTQRNRDRIVWSSGFRRTGYKTQVFPHEAPDHFRRRLTHSIEVSQLATSLAGILKLNSMAAEAIALAHDLGHTAFGHAGEHALDGALREMGLRLLRPAFPGLEADRLQVLLDALGLAFTHYDQGVRVVEYLEHEYYTKEGRPFTGLGLGEPTKDGILKHVRKDFPKQWHRSLYNKILRNYAFRRFQDRPTYLEGQAVAFADYLSYFVSDLEDAILAKIIRLKDLRDFGLVGRIRTWLIQDAGPASVPDFEIDSEFYKFKRLIIKFLMLDTVDATRGRLADVRHEDRTCEYALRCPRNGVLPSPEVCNEMDEIYERCIAGRIHKHHLVIAANFKAERVIKELFETLSSEPGLVPQEYREANSEEAFNHVYERISTAEAGIDPSELKAFMQKEKETIVSAFVARDYVAEMSDFLATKTHMRLMLSSESLY